MLSIVTKNEALTNFSVHVLFYVSRYQGVSIAGWFVKDVLVIYESDKLCFKDCTEL